MASNRRVKIALIVNMIVTPLIAAGFFAMKSVRGSLSDGEKIFWGSLVVMMIGVSFSFARILKQSKDESTKS